MPKYKRMRDERSKGGPRLSVSIDARSAEEADEIFEDRWRQKTGTVQGASDRLQVRTTKEIQAEAMTPAALAVKRNTRGMKQ